MKLFTKAASRSFAYLLLSSFFMLMTSCSSSDQVVKPELSGEDMFREIVLFQGENVGEKIPAYAPVASQLAVLDEEQKIGVQDFCDQIIASVNKLDPNYLEHFKSTMLTDDPYLIQEEIGKAGKLVYTILSNSDEYGKFLDGVDTFIAENKDEYDFSDESQLEAFASAMKKDMKKNHPEVGDDKAIALAFFVVVAAVIWEAAAVVNVVAVATVAAYAAALVETLCVEEEIRREGSNLGQDQIVASIIHSY